MGLHLPIRSLGRATSTVVASAILFLATTAAFAQPDTPAKGPDKTKAWVGFFESSELAIVIQDARGQEDGGPYAGEIRKEGKTFPFTGTVSGVKLQGEFKHEGEGVDFSLTQTETGLKFKSGFQSYALKRGFDPQRYVGTFNSPGLTVAFTIADKHKYVGRLVNETSTVKLNADLIGAALKGTFFADGKQRGFSCTIKEDELTFKTKLETIKLNRSSTKSGTGALKFVATEGDLYAPENVVETSIVVGPMNRRTAMFTHRAGKTQAVIDGLVLPWDYQFAGAIFSPDAKRVSFLGRRGREFFVLVDGKPFGPYQFVGRSQEFFSPDSQRWTFAARLEGKWHVIDTGKPGPAFDEIRGIFFSKNSKRLSYIGRRGDHWHVVVDRDVGLPVEAIVYGRTLFSPDSKQVAYVMATGSKVFVVLNGEPSAGYDHVSRFLFSPDSERFAFAATRGKHAFVVIDGKEQASFDGVDLIAFSSDGKHVAYRARRDGKPVVVADGEIVGEGFEAIENPIYNETGERLAFVAIKKGKATLWDQGRAGTPFEQIRNLSFSRNGKRLSYLAQKEDQRWVYVVDGQATQPFDAPPGPIVFSPDHRHFAFICKQDGVHYLSIDGIHAKQIPAPLRGTRPVFNGSDKLHTLYRRGKQFVRLDVEITK